MRHKRRPGRLGVTKRHDLLVLALLLPMQSPGTYDTGAGKINWWAETRILKTFTPKSFLFDN